ncbi:unnamed protein product [Notodromas monacha]|uniref:TOG domain-containing protein n=1 Tax=Notodromas monacha TaxID=399045 RepID=A0A7R9BGD1_9CRUS|nr:unnamed protein product [Notodromas monacha]CAG0913373.1 unnamed protein product [Notodromas monacha]
MSAKEISLALQSASPQERKAAFQRLSESIKKDDVPEGAFKAICKLLPPTLPLYLDGRSQSLVRDLLSLLFKQHGAKPFPYVVGMLVEIADSWVSSGNPTRATANFAATALRWSSIASLEIDENLKQTNIADVKKLIRAQTCFYACVRLAGVLKLLNKCNDLLFGLWDKRSTLLRATVDTLQEGELTTRDLIFASLAYSKYYKCAGNVCDSLKANILEWLAKGIISSKTKPDIRLAESCSFVLKSISLEEFKSTLFPVISKALLRSPEIILQFLAAMVKVLTIDISTLSVELTKTLGASLTSKEDSVREDAVALCYSLALQSGDEAAVQEMVKILFQLYNGSQGKLVVAAHKISVLQAIHEGTLITCIEQAHCWFSRGLPAESGSKIIAALLTSVAGEGLSAACLLLELQALGKCDTSPSLLTQGFWDAVGGKVANCVFLSDRFVVSASPENQQTVLLLCERLLTEHEERIERNINNIMRAMLIVLFQWDYATKKKATPSLRRLVKSLRGPFLMKQLVATLAEFLLECPKMSCPNDEAEGEMKTKDSESILLKASSVRDAIFQLAKECKKSTDPSSKIEAENMSVQLLVPVHHISLYQLDKHIWERMIRELNLDIEETLSKKRNDVVALITEEFRGLEAEKNALKTLVRIAPEMIVEPVVEFVAKECREQKYFQVTQEECAIHATSSGTLYKQSIIEALRQENALNAKNMKRESKAYSYKEQMEEIELKKELSKKKKPEAKKALDLDGLTPKQKETVKLELEKEEGIRFRLDELLSAFKKVPAAMIESLLEGNRHALGDYLMRFMFDLLRLLSSPLIAKISASLFVRLRECAFSTPEEATLGEEISYVTLRLWKPECEIEERWLQEPLKDAAERVITSLHALICGKKREPEFDEDGNKIEYEPEMLHFPKFTYSFPMITATFGKNSNTSWSNGENLLLALKVLDLYGARANDTMPLKELLELLVYLIAEKDGTKAQIVAVQVLNHVGRALSGVTGCTLMSETELNIFLDGVKHPRAFVREACVRALSFALKAYLDSIRHGVEIGNHRNQKIMLETTERIWIAKFDKSEEISSLADALFESAGLNQSPLLIDRVIEDVCNRDSFELREASARALAELLRLNSSFVPQTLEKLLDTYQENLAMSPPVTDSFGRVVIAARDLWEGRAGIASAIMEVAPHLDPDSVVQLMSFFVRDGLGDRQPDVGKAMLQAALTAVDAHGKEMVMQLLPLFESFLDKAPLTRDFDSVRQGVIILMGSLARHLELQDAKVKPILGKLVQALSTPSEQVQAAVASCLPPLVPSLGPEADQEMLDKMMRSLLEGTDYGQRRGAAFGIAGFVKGLGILALKQKNIMPRITDAIQDKKNARHREGALLALEQLCSSLGRLFEPYVVHVLPHLLLCFGDPDQYVREAAEECAKAVMGKLSAHGVKLVLPSLLAALEEDSWRTKTGSVELLGAMAFCAPKQLSSCLPNIVPKLIEVLGDSHPKVQKAGTQALKQIGSVIRNPEIQALVPILLGSVEDPSKKTSIALNALLDTQFVHAIDAPSLALIMPVVQRAFQDRSTETRKMAAQIIGNMYSLTDKKDLQPYLPSIIPGLKNSLRDPVPEVRSVSARALGAMVKGMGESSFDDLLPWLMQTLTSESGAVDRSGAAQGLAEVVGGLGAEKLHRLMPDIIATAQRSDIAPHVKDGYMMLFIYFPTVFKQEFIPYIGEIVHPILKALADESEYVRATALKAGQRIINAYADSAIALLLPELERGLFHDNWRIRYSSVQLLGDLLYRISGVTGKMTTESAGEDDNFGTEYSHKAILGALGEQRRNRVLSGLYMGRSDTAVMVRQSALHVWKVVVSNTPKTLREILPTLFSVLLGCLASNSPDKKTIAAKTLGDLVRKLGERVLPEIMPILEKGLSSPHPDQRQGVCIGLSEIMASTSRDMVLAYVDSLVPTIRKALADPLPEVRHAAAKTYDSLHSTVGNRALDDILKPMLEHLNDPEIGEFTLDGLRHVMAIKSRVVLPYLIPQLTAPPVNTKALSALASVAGESLGRHLPKILPALLDALEQEIAEHGAENVLHRELLEQCQGVILPVTDDVGVRTIVDILMEEYARKARTHAGGDAARRDARKVVAAQKDDGKELKRIAAVMLLSGFCVRTKVDLTELVPQLMRGLLHLFTDKDPVILQASWEALSAVTKTLDAKAQLEYVYELRQSIKFVASDLPPGVLLPGFCLPKASQQSILNGTPEQKELAAVGMGEIIRLTSAEALKPSVVSITGPLIRVLSDRFGYTLKVEVLVTLSLLMDKVGQHLKPFLPQLQTTFLRALNDPNRLVRLKAGVALANLMKIHLRADPLFVELHTIIRNGGEDQGVRDTCLQALRGVLVPCGDKMSASLRKSLIQTLVGLLTNLEDQTRLCAAGCLGAMAKWMDEDERKAFFAEYIFDDDKTKDWVVRHGCSATLSSCLKESSESLMTPEYERKVPKMLLACLSADRIPIVICGVEACGYLVAHCIRNEAPVPVDIITPFAKMMNHTANEVKIHMATTITYLWFFARDKLKKERLNLSNGDQATIENASSAVVLPAAFLKPVIPMLVNGTKEKNSLVKSASEMALAAVLEVNLPGADVVQQSCLKILDPGASDALSDVISKLSRRSGFSDRPRDEDVDCTLLT